VNATLNREEYEAVICRGQPDEYPKNTEQAATELRTRGYDARPQSLDYLIRKGEVAPDREGRNYEWQPEDVDQAADSLAAEEAFTSRTWCNIELGISAAQRIRALREAVWGAINEFEAEVPESEDWFVMHVHTPRMSRDGWVEFTLADDMRAALETRRGELRSYNRIMLPDEKAWRRKQARKQKGSRQ